MEWQGENKQRPSYWQWHQSFILGDLNWKIFQVGYPVDTPTDMYLSPNWMLSSAQSVKHLKKKKKMLHTSHTAEQSVWAQIHVCRGVHRVTGLEKCPFRISKDEAPTPLPVVGPLFISFLLFHLSWVLLGAWRFGLFRSVYSSFHNRLDHIREPAFDWVFYFPNLSVFVSSYVKIKKVLFVLVQ